MSVPFGRSRARGVVVEVVDAAPVGVGRCRSSASSHELPPALVDLALWLADYYGSTPARALELVAPVGGSGARSRPLRASGSRSKARRRPTRLSDDQEAASRGSSRDRREGGRLLLYGPTGSGKTEVYLQAAAAALERGLGTIVLVPEIALTPQTVGRFRARFGDTVALLHSGADGRRAAGRARADLARRGARRGRRTLGDLRADARTSA